VAARQSFTSGARASSIFLTFASCWGGPPGSEKYKVPFNQERVFDPLTIRFLWCCNEPSDINEHLPRLYSLARQCDHVTEFGMGHGRSTTAFLAAAPKKFVSVDVVFHNEVHLLRALATRTSFTFVQASTLEVEIEPTDLLFIDTRHTYAQLRAELARHAGQVSRWIALHDTTTFGAVGEGGEPGLWPAVEEFLATGGWKVSEKVENNNGLTVLERCP
jgi:hypothetical protein